MDLKELGLEVRRLRRERGLSQQQVAEHIMMSRVSLNALETGRAGDVGIKKIMKIIDYFGMELCLREKSPFPTFEELLNG
ncbi:MAG TPA: helix-turn-helix transcriptional regulator [Methylophaga sp.]|nr:helix-turn-helix transcriptional regulator [Methylophaga sp.]